MIFYIFFIIIMVCIGMSLRTLFIPSALQDKYLSWESFVYLLFIYTTVLLGFGLIYFLLMENNYVILIENGNSDFGTTAEKLWTSIYFSGVTLFSIGYGDVSPIGVGRIIAIMEGLIGYTIPASFVVRTVVELRKENS